MEQRMSFRAGQALKTCLSQHVGAVNDSISSLKEFTQEQKEGQKLNFMTERLDFQKGRLNKKYSMVIIVHNTVPYT